MIWNQKKARATLQELCTLVTDGTHDSPKLLREGMPFIKGKHISGGKIDFHNCDYISYEDHLRVIARSKPEKGDILFSNIGSVGDTVLVNTTAEFSIKNVALFKPDPQRINGRYLFYHVISEAFQHGIRNKRSGSAQPFIGLTTLREHEIEYHADLSAQSRIAEILGSYDDLIENNTRRIQVLEEMAQAIYREWFVNFCFPGHEQVEMAESEIGPVPMGWQIRALSTVAPQRRTNVHPSRSPEEVFAHFSLPAYDESKQPTLDLGSTISSTKFLVEPGAVLISKLNPRIPRVWLPQPPTEYRSIASTEFVVLKPMGIPRSLLFLTLSSDKFLDSLVGRALGTSTSHQRVKPDDLLSTPVLIPDPDTARVFDGHVEPMLAVIETLRRKNKALSSTRDLLLPRLISGELDVSDLDIETGELAA